MTSSIRSVSNRRHSLRSLFVLCLLSSFIPLHSQEVPVYSVTSPEASSLGEYGTVPVSLFTGVPEISIPLYEMKFGKYSIPISADYHLASVRPNDPPGVLGIGWTLKAGGVISRTVRGVYDEKKGSVGVGNGFYWHSSEMKAIEEGNTGSFDTQTRDKIQGETAADWYELAADEFSFSFLGYSGNFYRNADGGWTVVSDSDIKVEFNPASGFVRIDKLQDRIPNILQWPGLKNNTVFFKEFTLVTPDGCRYTFGGIEAMDFCIPYYSRNTDDIIVTSWHLARIETPEGYTVSYSYLSTGGDRPVMVDLRYVPGSRALQRVENGRAQSEGVNLTGRRGFTGFLLYGCNLSAINGVNEKISFFYYPDRRYNTAYSKFAGEALYWQGSESRDNIYSPRKPQPYGQFFYLTTAESCSTPAEVRENIAYALRCNVLHRMAIDKKGDDCDRSVYFEQYGPGRRKLRSIIWRAGIPEIIKKITIGGGIGYTNYVIPDNDSGLDMPEYKFTYDPGLFPESYVFPKSDQWGYYTGSSYSPSGMFIISDIDNELNTLATKYETLTEIKYPTGGSSIFEYEGNNYSRSVNYVGIDPANHAGRCGGLRIRSITNRARDLTITGITRYHYTDSPDSHISSGIRSLGLPFSLTYSASPAGEPGIRYDIRQVSSKGFPVPVTNMNSPNVGYSSVIEERLDSAGRSSGWTKYIFSNYGTDIYGDSHNDENAFHSYNCPSMVGVPYTSRSMERGRLLSKQYYSADGVLVMEEQTRYGRVCGGSMVVADQRLINFRFQEFNSTASLGWLTRVYTHSYLPISTETHRYDSGDYSSKEEQEYNQHRLISARRVQTSDGGVREERHSYASDFPEYSWMTDAHVLSPVLQTRISEGTAWNLIRSRYSNAGQFGRVTPYINRIECCSSEHPEPWTEYEALSADAWGNPTEIVQNGRHTVLHWERSGQVLSRRVDNMTEVLLDSLTGVPVSPNPSSSVADVAFPVGREELVSRGAILSSRTYNSDLQPVRECTPDSVVTFYEYDALGRLREQYLWTSGTSLLKRKKTLSSFEYRYYELNLPTDDEGHMASGIGTVIGSTALQGESAPPSQGTQSEQTPVFPDEPLTPVNGGVRYDLTTGYVTKAGLKYFKTASLNDSTNFVCYLEAKDTITANFKVPSFSYTRGIDGSSMPADTVHLMLCLSDVSGSSAKVMADLPFIVDEQTLECSSADSVLFKLPPGLYMLVYHGFATDWAPYPVTESSAAQASSIQDSENSSIIVAVECLPLIKPGQTGPLPRSSITAFVSTDGSDSNGMYTKRFCDDFGRPYTESLVGASTAGRTLISLQEYDGWGRKSRTWLPGAAPVGTKYVETGKVSKYIYDSYLGETAPYAYDVYENSPLGRAIESYGPGSDWQSRGKAVRTFYLVNSVGGDPALECMDIRLQWIGNSPKIIKNGLFAAGTLSVVRTENEDGCVGYAFTDRLGRTVLTRQLVENSGFLDTYFIYDNMDRLVAVLPPALSALLDRPVISQQDIDRYAWLYRYDSRGRNCSRKLPGAEWVEYIHDDSGRMVFGQDGELRRSGKSVCYLYDIHGRECVRLLCDRDVTRGEEIDKVVAVIYTGQAGEFMGYSFAPGSAIDLGDSKILSASYYDGYHFRTDFSTGLQQDTSHALNAWPVGCPTGMFSSITDGDRQTDEVLWSSTEYDWRGRTVRLQAASSCGKTETQTITYNFTGNPVSRHIEHRYDGGSLSEDISYSYDSWGRPLEETHSLSGRSGVKLFSNTYDALGRLSRTDRGSSDKLSETRNYDVRSCLTSLSSKLYSENQYYGNPRTAASTPMYGGAVSSVEWKAAGDGSFRAYDFRYDKAGRLTQALYSNVGNTLAQDNFSTSYSYDQHGNLLTLQRWCTDDRRPEFLDRLTMEYGGNRLIKVSDSPTSKYDSVAGFQDGADLPVEYTYDSNGNLRSDANRGVNNISYSISGHVTGVEADSVRISFMRTAGGGKLGQRIETASDTTETEYFGNMVWKDGRKKYLLFDGGYIDLSAGQPAYMFYLKDHLGNNRIIATTDGKVVQVNHYYPYGVSFPMVETSAPGTAVDDPVIPGEPPPEWERADTAGLGFTKGDGLTDDNLVSGGGLAGGGNVTGGDPIPGDGTIEMPGPDANQPWRYSGNELLSGGGLSVYDFDARLYDPSLGRFFSQDPLAEKYYGLSPYSYCAGNPVNLIDPQGTTIYEIDGIFSVIEDGYYDQVSVSERQFKALTRLWNSGKGKRYDDRRQKFMDASGYIDGSGNWVLSASRKTDLYSPKNGESAVVMAFISRDLAIDEPSDACAPKWLFYGAFALAAHEYDYYVAKQQRELERIDQRPDGPEGVMYSLRAARSGYYPNVRGGMVYLNEGDVWKYGETTQKPPESRYGGKSKIEAKGLEMYVEATGTQKQMKRAENMALYKYFYGNATLPPGNSIFR